MAEDTSTLNLKWVSIYLDDETLKILEKLEKSYTNKSKFVREAIKEKARKMGLI